ncbi:MAG: extracellular solute-binding protein [Chloroflexi bacterium]|nr:extracellular solute-binding protein [Chloroflexota bacterium]
MVRRLHVMVAVLVLVLVVALFVSCTGDAAPSSGQQSKPTAVPVSAENKGELAAQKKTEPAAAKKATAVEKQPTTVEEKLAALNQLAPDARQAKLMEEVKKEGKVVFYTTEEPATLRAEQELFKNRYPFLAAEFLKVSTEEALQKTVAEFRAGKQIADVIQLPAVEFQELIKEGVIGKYLSPELKVTNPEFFDKEGYWSTAEAIPEVLTYNQNLVRAEEAPKTLQDLLDPKWKGKLARTRHGGRWLAATLKFLGEEKGMEFVQKLAQQNMTIAESNTQVAQLVVSGEALVGFDIHASSVMTQINKGAPLAVQFTEPMYFYSSAASIAKLAPHPYSAALIMDFIMSKEGQEVFAKNNWIGGRSDVKYPWGDEMKTVKSIVAYSPSLVGDRYNELQSKFESLFIRK